MGFIRLNVSCNAGKEFGLKFGMKFSPLAVQKMNCQKKKRGTKVKDSRPVFLSFSL